MAVLHTFGCKDSAPGQSYVSKFDITHWCQIADAVAVEASLGAKIKHLDHKGLCFGLKFWP